jgi:carboxypeptidase C (cathepsin A)
MLVAQRTGTATPDNNASPHRRAPHQPLPQVHLDAPIVTRHSGVFNGKRVDYSAAVEPIIVPDATGKPAARLVAISYTADHSGPNRPVLFAYNGGPIAPSSIIHMGLLGPKRAAIPDDISADPATFALADNPYSPLDVADIVFFDPAETGFSRPLPGIDFAANFASVSTDARELTGLVISWCEKHGRSASPKYLVGESYGTIRSSEAANQLMKAGTPLAGVILLGQAVNIIEYAQRPDNIVSYAVSLPTLAAVCWAQGKAQRKGRSFEEFVNQAADYGAGEYLTVLFLGQRAPLARRQAVAEKLEEFTGLSAAFYMDHDLKVAKSLYQRSLISGEILGTDDARYHGLIGKGDPFTPVQHALERLFDSYLRDDLKAGDVGLYNNADPAPPGLNGWDYGPNKGPFGNWPFVQSLTEVFHAIPNFRLLVGDGFYDTQTTIGAQDYLLADSYWPADRVRTRHYQGGHMAYTVEASAKAIDDDIRSMVIGAW